MLKTIAAFTLAFIALCAVAPTASASTFGLIHWFRGGEADTNPSNGGVVSLGKDSGTNSNNMSAVASPTWSNVSTAYPLLNGVSSTFAYSFNGTNTLLGSSTTIPTSNFGMDIWLRPSSNSGNQLAYYLGNNLQNGFGLGIHSGTYGFFYYNGSFQFVNSFVPATNNTWTEFAVVNQDGVFSFYANGVSVGSTFSASIISPSNFLSLGSGNGVNYSGLLDEARMFTFASGTFDAKTSLNIPEPSTWALGAGSVALAFAAWRKRRVAA